MGDKKNYLILGAAGRDFHNFNVVFRSNPSYNVVGFTATQIPGISGRIYPPSLAGPLYPDGIPVYDENKLEKIIKEKNVDYAVFSYSDISNNHIMAVASRALSAGANFLLLSDRETFLHSKLPVIAICAVRTGCGKSQTTRFVMRFVKSKGKKPVAIRHPMPYGYLHQQRLQRFEKIEDLNKHNCTIEEREEYLPHIKMGNIVYAGIDYEAILREAEKEADIIIWDGGNNDTPFIKPDLWVTVTDPFRPEDMKTHHPGQVNFINADVILINKVNTAEEKDIEKIEKLAKAMNPDSSVIRVNSAINIPDVEAIKGKKVVVVEDGPTLTHGNMAFGAGKVAAMQAGAAEIVDPRPYAIGSIKEAYERYSQLEDILPALGYSDEQIRELEHTINKIECDAIISATPADLTDLLNIKKPIVSVQYELEEAHIPSFTSCLEKFLKSKT